MRKHFFYDGNGNKRYYTVNVQAFGAIGNGIADDTTAMQNALDALKNSGGTINIPNGIYRLTKPLYYYSNQSIMFENGARLLQGAAINALMIAAGDTSITGYNGVHDVLIDGGIFDGGAYTTNNTLLGCSHGRNIAIRNCKFINSYGTWHNVEINSTKHATIENCEFEGRRKTGANGCMIQVDSYYDNSCYPWYTGAVDSTPSRFVEIMRCRFYGNTISPAIGNHSNGGSCVRIHDCIFEQLTSNRGAINFQGITDLDVYNNTFTECTIGVANANAVVHGNRFIECATPFNAAATAYNNMVDGELKGAAGSAGKDGDDGYTPQKGVDYWTGADQESIVQQVIAALGTPVFGKVDADNNIILTGELADGTYTIVYEDAEGNVTEIGTYTGGRLGDVPITPVWNKPYKLDSGSGAASADSGNTYAYSDGIPFVEGTELHISCSDTTEFHAHFYYYDADDNFVGKTDWAVGTTTGVVTPVPETVIPQMPGAAVVKLRCNVAGNGHWHKLDRLTIFRRYL